jgi:N-formylglutamate amidohydrolase
VPRLFDGQLPQFNIGTNSGQTCDPALTAAVEAACDASGLSRVTNGRFKGGWTTRRYGQPAQGVHAIQMELACRGYMDDPADAPTPRDLARALSSIRRPVRRAACAWCSADPDVPHVACRHLRPEKA